jgi:hypothetical protein
MGGLRPLRHAGAAARRLDHAGLMASANEGFPDAAWLRCGPACRPASRGQTLVYTPAAVLSAATAYGARQRAGDRARARVMAPA